MGAFAIGAAGLAIALTGDAASGRGPAGTHRATPDASDAGADADAVPQQEATCGRPGLPPCPMQAWMRANVAAPLASADLPALTSGLQRSAKLCPDATWTSWVEIAETGAAAAKRGDIAAARASCKACHEAWREAYRAKHRLRPVAR